VREEPFEVHVGGGSLVGCAAADGAPALLLHGGPAISDHMGSCALELEGLFTTLRYTQRGVPPSTAGPPYSIESHVEDALAVLARSSPSRRAATSRGSSSPARCGPPPSGFSSGASRATAA
jgi:pimeloyl-ACP methyl ester carboxylesterase